MVIANIVPSMSIMPIVPHQMRLRYPNTTVGSSATLSSRFCIFPLLQFSFERGLTLGRPKPTDECDRQRHESPDNTPGRKNARNEQERCSQRSQKRPDRGSRHQITMPWIGV